jgi:hypothetical protein
LINLGSSTAGNQGNLRTGQAAALAGGIVGGANAEAQGAQNLLNLGGALGGAIFSDPRLKQNIKHTGTENGFNTYQWSWNEKANDIGLFGGSNGVMADEVKLINPAAIVNDESGYMKVDYGMIGVKH